MNRSYTICFGFNDDDFITNYALDKALERHKKAIVTNFSLNKKFLVKDHRYNTFLSSLLKGWAADAEHGGNNKESS